MVKCVTKFGWATQVEGQTGMAFFFRWQCRPDEFYVGVHAKMYAQSKGLELFDTVSAFRVMRCATFGFQTQLEYW